MVIILNGCRQAGKGDDLDLDLLDPIVFIDVAVGEEVGIVRELGVIGLDDVGATRDNGSDRELVFEREDPSLGVPSSPECLLLAKGSPLEGGGSCE